MRMGIDCSACVKTRSAQTRGRDQPVYGTKTRRYSLGRRCRSAGTTASLQRVVTCEWYSGSRGRSHHRGPRKTASASTSDDDDPLITRWWWPRPLGRHRQKQCATEPQESSEPVGGPKGNRVSLICKQYLCTHAWHKKSCAMEALSPKKTFVTTGLALRNKR